MGSTEVSMIIPVQDGGENIAGILNEAAEQIYGMCAEVIVIDMGAASNGLVREGYRVYQEKQLRGGVVRNGDADLASAMNTGLQRAEGEFITFLLPDGVYQGYLEGYLQTARQGADMVFGCTSESGVRAAERRVNSAAIKSNRGADFACEMIRGNLRITPRAILVRRTFLEKNRIQFREGVQYGVGEEFIFRCLLRADTVLQSPTVPITATAWKQDSSANVEPRTVIGKEIFDLVDAMIRVYDWVRLECQHEELIGLFRYQKLPETVMECVERLLWEGMGHRFIRNCIKQRGYQRLLESNSKFTAPDLKRRIHVWKHFPWLYRATGRTGSSATK